MSDRSFDPEALLQMGRIWKPHGVRGELKVIPEGDDPERMLDLKTVVLGSAPAAGTPYTVEGARMQQTKRGPLVLLRLDGVEGRDEAETLRRLKVFALEDDLPALEEDEHYVHDLIGAEVVDPDGEVLGTLASVEETAAHDLFVISRPDGRESFVPVVDAFVRSIDAEAMRIVITPIEGLLD